MVASLLCGLVLTVGMASEPDRPAGCTSDTGPALRPGGSATLVAARRRPRRPPPRVKKEEPAAAPESAAPSPAAGGGDVPIGSPSGRTRIEFEGLQIKGQTTKAGEVQILERRDSEMKSMVKRRTSFREEIIRSVFPVAP